MKYLIIYPRGTKKIGDSKKVFKEVEAKAIQSKETFVQQNVGKEAIEVTVGDYVFWVSNPNAIVEEESGQDEFLETITLTPNLLINEMLFAHGNAVVTAHIPTCETYFDGLNEQDIANIYNAFTKSTATIVEDVGTGLDVAVDKIDSSLLSFTNVEENSVEVIEPKILEIDDEKYTENN